MTHAHSLCIWIEICATTFSPWLFEKKDLYTLVDSVEVLFVNIPESEQSEYERALVCKFGSTHFKIDRDTYTPWSGLFNFEWEPLKLYVEKSNDTITYAYFVDGHAQESRCTWYADPIKNETSVHWHTFHEHVPAIPWLRCES